MNKKQSLAEQLALLQLIENGKKLAAETLNITYEDLEAARENLVKIHAFAKQVEDALNNTHPIDPSPVSVKVLVELEDFFERHLN